MNYSGTIDLPYPDVVILPKHHPQSDNTTTAPSSTSLVRIPRDQHCISRRDISPGCLKILYQLNDAGFDAFIVGGGVRDLLLGLHPKDFDIATNATPEEIRDLFRSSRIIGRRFKIVHVRMGREVIEVSTFRAAPEESLQVDAEHMSRKITHIDSAKSASGMLLRDNVYGDINGDAKRRDFTVNALYYTVRNFEIHDYVDGMRDVDARVLRMIGDPEKRYQEDPVRTLRAIRLSVKLDFDIEQATAAPIRECSEMLASIPPARLFDECLKLFFGGHALATWKKLCEYDIFSKLFPATKDHLNDEMAQRFIEHALINTDARLADEQSVTPYFLLAVFLWPEVEKRFNQIRATGEADMIAMADAGNEVLAQQLERVAIPRRFSLPMREIWEMQLRLPRRTGKRAETLLTRRRFRAAYDFLLLREAAGVDTGGLGEWWTQFQQASDADKMKILQLDGQGSKRPHSKSRRRKVKSGKRENQ